MIRLRGNDLQNEKQPRPQSGMFLIPGGVLHIHNHIILRFNHFRP